MRYSLFLLPFLLFAKQAQYWDEGTNQANQILGAYKNNLDIRINNPITKSQELATLDNSKKAVVSIDCGKEYNILKITYVINSGGDITIEVDEDFNLDGKFENVQYFSNISGVCSNGFIKCNSGTWNNCKYFLLKFNGTSFSLDKANSSDLAGCYCVNNSCGGISNDYAKILSTISGIFSSLLNKGYFIVSGINLSENYAYVQGKSVNCGGESVPMGMDEVTLTEKTDEAKLDNPTYTLLYETTQNEEANNSIDETFKNGLTTKYNNIATSSQYSSGTYSYKDENKNVSGTIFVGDINQSRFCEVEWTDVDTQAYQDYTNKAMSTSSATTKKSEIIECKKDGNGNWYCPIKPGQTIKHDCGKIDDFKEVVGALSGITEAVKDFTCSKE